MVSELYEIEVLHNYKFTHFNFNSSYNYLDN